MNITKQIYEYSKLIKIKSLAIKEYHGMGKIYVRVEICDDNI